MTSISIQPAAEIDAVPLVSAMREADEVELKAHLGMDPLDVVVFGVQQASEAWSAFVNDRLMLMWGVSKLDDNGRGWGWLLTTTVVDENKKLFWKLSRTILPDLLSRWASLENCMDIRHTAALRWGARLGFQFDPPKVRGVEQVLTQRFVITKETLNV